MTTMFDSYRRYFARVWPVLRDMSRRGIPIDSGRRAELKDLIAREDERVTVAIQGIVPSEMREPKQGLKRNPLLECPDCGEKVRGDHECH